MPADYEKIRAENTERYGWDTAVLNLLGRLYSERTHFIFELIQNAEDAGATELAFELSGDRLEVRHDGRPFTEADVRGICGVGQSGKSGDLTAIGEFGIGFKSVYAYTRTPRVRGGGERFRIERYVRPYAVDDAAEPVEPAGETLFTFPFDNDSVPAAIAVQEIGAALNEIEASTLLFLRSIRRMRVAGAGVAGAVLERAEVTRGEAGRSVTLTKRRAERAGQADRAERAGQADRAERAGQAEEWLVWHRGLEAAGLPGLRVEIAFQVAGGGAGSGAGGGAGGGAGSGAGGGAGGGAGSGAGGLRVVRRERSPLVVSFPTEKETFLGFLIQGPYRTTPARDNIPEHDPANQALARETAALLARVLRELRDDRLLGVEVLECLPLDPARFGASAMLRPLFDTVRELLGREEMVPVAGGGYARAAQVMLARGAGLRELLPPELLGELYGAGRPVAFADEGIAENLTPALWRYLREEIGVGEVTPEEAVRRMTAEFLGARTDGWIGEFYQFLYRNPALWMAGRSPGESAVPAVPAGPAGAAREMPVIRLEDGGQVAPFDGRGRPAAYLPGPAGTAPTTALPTVRRAVAGQAGARRFLEALGLREPDVVAEVLDGVLPRYDGLELADLELARHDADIEAVARALVEAPAGHLAVLVEELRRTSFLIGENAATGERRLMPPPKLYLRLRELEVYFDGNPETWFASDRYGPWLAQLRGMGVRDSVGLRAREADQLGYVTLVSEFARHERGVAGFDPEAEFEGMEFALAHPGHARSEYVWNVLLATHRHLVAGVVERSHRAEFADASREHLRSQIGAAAAAAAWLPGASGGFHRPGELSVGDLPGGLARDELLGEALGMVAPVVEEASRRLGLPAAVLRGLMEHPDLVAAVERELAARASGSDPGPAGDRGH